ncbi:MAG TPA: M48 family metallopeptidase [Pyrinomonadaceae bacterium]|nr:M48 family metallopeptidase [Pyrinomonadaceae bacterium]
MRTNNYPKARMLAVWLMALAIMTMPLSAFAQGTRISYHSNKYSPSDDVKLGRQAAAEAEQQLPILRDSDATAYLERVGQRLVASIPQEFQHPEFNYYFKLVDVKDINAFALPGGPMYVNRGTVEVAHNEGELAGVMAHELSHVALRHGTAQATKAQKYGLLAGIAGIAGAILAGPSAGQIGQAAVGAYFLKFSREYETEADVLGAQMMARAGYDPHDLANMFKTIEQQSGGSGGPTFLSDHPSPANRYARINQEAQMLRVSNRVRDDGDFERVQSRLRGMPRARSMQEVAQGGRTSGNNNSYPAGNISNSRIAYPSSRYRAYTEGQLFRVSVPDNWRELPGNNDVWFSPEGAYGSVQNTAVFTHGVNFGMAQAQSNDLRQATDAYISQLVQGNRNMRQQGNYQRGTIDRHEALAITLSNANEATGRTEVVTIYTTLLRNGTLFYMIALAPQDEYRNYQGAFTNILRSVKLND